MRIDKLTIDNFKNLKKFSIDLDETQLTSVLIGCNGAGKSNLLEALVIIFRDLDLKNMTTTFTYEITYHCTNHVIRIRSDKEKSSPQYEVDGKKVGKKAFYDMKTQVLPANVFAYYSGPSNRLEKYFEKHQDRFYRALLNGDDDALRPLFYARMIHSNFVLLAFFSFFEEQNAKFLRDYFEIDSVESILFELHQPNWSTTKKSKALHKSDFWGSRGVVRGFLDDLYQYATAPIKETVTFKHEFSTETKEVIYLYLKDQETLGAFAKKYGSNEEFFKFLESTYLSDLIEEIRIKIRKTDGTVITFNELSEGEQQLLTVLGLLKFTKSKESLFLLDEPDTHLNPAWKFDYLKLLQDVVGSTENSQIIISTHDPIVIGGLTKEAVSIFERNTAGTTVRMPETDPKGMGVAGLLTSELFDLPSTLDRETQAELDRKRQLQYKQNRTADENAELASLEEKLQGLGFTRTIRDPLYDKFLEKLYSLPQFQNTPIKDAERKEMTALMDDILTEIMEEENK